jgi:hypothetical protein
MVFIAAYLFAEKEILLPFPGLADIYGDDGQSGSDR